MYTAYAITSKQQSSSDLPSLLSSSSSSSSSTSTVVAVIEILLRARESHKHAGRHKSMCAGWSPLHTRHLCCDDACLNVRTSLNAGVLYSMYMLHTCVYAQAARQTFISRKRTDPPRCLPPARGCKEKMQTETEYLHERADRADLRAHERQQLYRCSMCTETAFRVDMSIYIPYMSDVNDVVTG